MFKTIRNDINGGNSYVRSYKTDEGINKNNNIKKKFPYSTKIIYSILKSTSNIRYTVVCGKTKNDQFRVVRNALPKKCVFKLIRSGKFRYFAFI